MSVEPNQLIASTMRVHGNPPLLVYNLLGADAHLTKIQGIRVDLVINRKILASTPVGGSGNVQVVVSQRRASKFEWNAGGFAGQQHQTVRVDIIGRALENQVKGQQEGPTARDIVDGVKRYIQELMFNKTFFGTGWLTHTETDAGYPSAPVGR